MVELEYTAHLNGICTLLLKIAGPARPSNGVSRKQLERDKNGNGRVGGGGVSAITHFNRQVVLRRNCLSSPAASAGPQQL